MNLDDFRDGIMEMEKIMTKNNKNTSKFISKLFFFNKKVSIKINLIGSVSFFLVRIKNYLKNQFNWFSF